MPATDAEIDQLIAALDSSRRVLLTTHIRPDGDALGTTAAMALALRRKGKEAKCLLLSEMPERYAFIYADAGVTWTTANESDPAALLREADALLVCDTGTWSQLPHIEVPVRGFRGLKLVLDHHVTQQEWADLKVVDTGAGAAAEVAARVIRRWGVKIDRLIAEPIYAALATDTGWFAYSNTSEKTLRLAADCLAAGTDIDRLWQRLRQGDRESRIRLWALGLASLELRHGGRLATMRLTRADYQRTGAAVDEAEDLVNEPLRITTVQVSAIFGQSPEKPDGQPIKVSLRSKGNVDVAHICQQFGGGGHPRAAGCRVDAPLDEVIRRVVAAVEGAGR